MPAGPRWALHPSRPRLQRRRVNLRTNSTAGWRSSAPQPAARAIDSLGSPSTLGRPGLQLDLHNDLSALIDQTLNLSGRPTTFSDDTPMLGAIPELDSMGVVALITALEEQFGIAIDDDEIDGAVFQTFGTLRAFVDGKLND